MSIRFRPDRNVWEVTIWSENKRLPRKTFKTEAEAIRYAGGSDLSVGNLFPNWIKDVWPAGRNQRMNAINTKLIVEGLGPKTLVTDIDDDKVGLFVEFLYSEGNKPGTVNRKLTCLRMHMAQAKKRKLIKHVPDIDSVSDLDNERNFVLTYEDEDRLLNALPEEPERPYRSFATFLLYTAARPSEAFRLEWRMADFDDASISLIKTKTDKPRTIPMTDPARAALAVTRKLGWPKPWERSPGSSANWYEQFYRVFCRRRDALGISSELVPYCLRHTCATRLGKGDWKAGEKGMDTSQLQLWLGHSNPAMTLRYTHYDTDALRFGGDFLSRKRKEKLGR